MNPWTIEVGEGNFEPEVLERSIRTPVVVDFWAPWCGPCRVLGPILERLAEEQRGNFILAKVNVDENPELAELFQIQGIPAVKIFQDGGLVDEFTGALPEDAVRAALARVLPSEADRRTEAAEKLAAEGKTAEAGVIFDEILKAEPNHDRALIGRGRLLAAANEKKQALDLLERVPLTSPRRKEADQLIARLALKSGGGADEARLRDALASDPEDMEKRFDLARALAAGEKYEEALREFLSVLKKDRALRDDGARKAMLQIFEILGNDSPLTDEYRAELARVLFR